MSSGERFKMHDTVRIIQFPEEHINAYGRVDDVHMDGRVWVENFNQPWSGTISQWFKPDELLLHHRADDGRCPTCGKPR